GSRLPQLWWVITSQSWIEVPINVYVLEHRDGLVLFDAGLDPAMATDPDYVASAIGRFLLHRIFRLHIGPDDSLDKKLEGLGYAAADVRKVVISHLHFDHIGGIAQVPHAELIVSGEEWRQLSGPHPEREWILREHIELPGAKWRQIEFAPSDDPLFAPFGGCYDVMGDGSMILLPTPGHTPGSMSMLVRTGGLPPLLLVADLTYDVDSLIKDQVPGTGDAALLRSSFAKVRALKRQLLDLVILASHDPGAAETLRAATQAIVVETKRPGDEPEAHQQGGVSAHHDGH
ncbi:MAG: N-acyl homoserine lactonase family protein, partial [Alphaproteobacteria bacterium]|nr:N-acyl homoserine lactonase family protein [Alphaproteobacteria bacterium]